MSRPEDNFEPIRKLLNCKRYEQPPPGYFSNFSDEIIARLEREDAPEYSSWWRWLIERFDAKPVLVCAYGLAMSTLLFAGFRLSQLFEAEVNSAPTLSGPWLAATPASPFAQAFMPALDASSPLTHPKMLLGEELKAAAFAAGRIHVQAAGFSPSSR